VGDREKSSGGPGGAEGLRGNYFCEGAWWGKGMVYVGIVGWREKGSGGRSWEEEGDWKRNYRMVEVSKHGYRCRPHGVEGD
jgi:hypothetical protein